MKGLKKPRNAPLRCLIIMKLLTLLLVSLLSALSLHAGIKIDVVVLTQEEVAKKTIPITCVLERMPESTVFKIALKEPFGVTGTFDSLELHVLKKPVVASELKKEFFALDRLARKERTRKKTATFFVKADELANSYLVISSWVGKEEGMAKLQSSCLPLAALAAQ